MRLIGLILSLGAITWSNVIADAVNLCYATGKTMFMAAGTSFGGNNIGFGVIFPANMPQTIAVTGVRDDDYYDKCKDCHWGWEVEVTAITEKGGEEWPLGLANSGPHPVRTGNSSVATAITSGIAALVLSANPSLTRAQLVSILHQSGSNYPFKHPLLGYGVIDAE